MDKAFFKRQVLDKVEMDKGEKSGDYNGNGILMVIIKERCSL